MTFEPKKFNQVFEDMRQRTAVLTDFEVGSVARTVYESFALYIERGGRPSQPWSEKTAS